MYSRRNTLRALAGLSSVALSAVAASAAWADTCPSRPINTVAEVFADPHMQARGMQIEMQHPQAGGIPLVASPIRLSDTPVQYRNSPPQLGQHTQVVLRDQLGLSTQAIDELSKQGVLG